MVEEGEQAMKGQSVLKSIPSIIPTITPPALKSSLLLFLSSSPLATPSESSFSPLILLIYINIILFFDDYS